MEVTLVWFGLLATISIVSYGSGYILHGSGLRRCLWRQHSLFGLATHHGMETTVRGRPTEFVDKTNG